MILVIDCGNSRIKWGCCEPPDARKSTRIAWIAQGVLELQKLTAMPDEWRRRQAPTCIVISNVAGGEVAIRLKQMLASFAVAPRWVTPGVEENGVRNTYRDPALLGADRWSALIGARAFHRGDCLVVMAGTATTVDVLSADGEFRGGLILPGMQLMKQALARETAGLEFADGEISNAPKNTADAIETGCLLAHTGAIEKMFRQLTVDPLCVLSGGAVGRVTPHLGIPCRVVDNLVLEGLARMVDSGPSGQAGDAMRLFG